MVQIHDAPDPAEEAGSRDSSNGVEEAADCHEPGSGELPVQVFTEKAEEAQSEQNGTGKGKKKKEKDKDRKPEKEKDKKLTKSGSSGKGKAVTPAKAAKPKVVTPSEDDIVRGECEKAVKTMKNNPQRAQKAIKETCQKHPTVSLGFRYQAYIEKRLAEQQNDTSKLKKQHIRTALEAARQATVLSPNSVEHALFYAVMLHEWVSEGDETTQATTECERALAITEPRDPALDMLGELPEELKTSEMRITHFKQQLRQLSHQVKLSGLQHVFKHVSMDSEGNLVPIVRQLQSNDKELEQRILQPKRANEVKKSTKTEAERRKQIEAQLEATRLLMHQREAGDKRKGGKEAQELVEVEEREQQRGGKGGEKKRGGKGKGQKSVAEDRLKKVQPFWENASAEKREELLQVPISELTQRLKSSRQAESSSVLEEALEFYKENQVWRYWVCNKCNAKFKTGIEHKVHVQEKHLIFPAGDEISPVDLPANFDIDKMLPTDGKEAARLLLEDALQKRVAGPETKPATSPNSPTSEAPFLDAHESVPNPADADGSEGGMSGESQFEEAGEQFEPLLKEGEEGEHFVDPENASPEAEHFCPTHGVNGCPITLGNQDIELPVVEDEKRAKALAELLGLVRVLIEHKLFFMNHQHKIFQFLVDVLQNLLPDANAKGCPWHADPSAAVEWQHDWNLLRLVDEESIGSVRGYLEDEILGEGSENKLTVTWNVEEDEPVILDISLSEDQNVLAPSTRLLHLLLHKEGDPFPRPEEGVVAEASVAEGLTAEEASTEEKAKDAPAAGRVKEPPAAERSEEPPREEKVLAGEEKKELEQTKEPLTAERLQELPAVEGSKESVPQAGLSKEGPAADSAKELSSADRSESAESSEKAADAAGGEVVPKGGEQVVEAPVPPCTEDQLRWVFDLDEKPSEIGPNSWTSDRDKKRRLAEDLYNELRKHHRDLSKAFQEKVELITEEASVRAAEQAILAEVKKAELQGGLEVDVPFILVLRGRMDELQKERLGLKLDKMDQRKAIESDVEAIRLILSKANSLQIHLQRTRLNGRGLAESSEDEGDFEFIGLRESNRFKNKKVRAAFDSVRQEMDNRLENIEKRIVELQRVISLGYVNLQDALGFDYRHALVPILKQHIQYKLNAAVEEDAVRKSDEARATLLSDLEKESKIVKPEAPKSVKAKDAKKKDKRKSKDARKAASAIASERDGEEGEDSDEEPIEEQKEKKAEQRRPEASYDEEDERRLAAVLERQRLEEEALAKEKNKSLDAAARRKIEQAEREALLREEEEERQLKRALAESKRQQETERKAKQQNGDADGGWELAGSSRRGGHLHQDRGPEERRSGHRETEQRRGDESMRPMTTGGMREGRPGGDGQRHRHEPGRIPVVQHPQHHQHLPRNTPPPSPPLAAIAQRQVDTLALRQLEDLSKSSSWSHVAGARTQQKPQTPRSLKDQQQQALVQRRNAAYYPDSAEAALYHQQGGNSNGSSPQWHHPQQNIDADMASLSLGGSTGWDGQDVGPDTRANGGLPGVVEDESDVSNLMKVLLPTPQKAEHGFAAALRAGLPEEARMNGSAPEGELERKDSGIPEDDKRFQADIQLAMQQSLQASGGPSRPQYPPVRAHPSANGSATAGGEMTLQKTVAGKGLVNETGQYNCFLNVVIQSLWHLRSFRRRLLERSSKAHAHVGHPCVVCALREIFTALDNRAPGPGQQGAVDPTPLRMALDAMYSETNFFQEGQMNDASEVLDAVFDAMHKAYTSPVGQEYANSDKEEAKPDGWTCTELRRCIVHDLFGLDVAEEMQCNYCGMVSRKLKYTSYFHNINASALRREKSLEPNHTLAELLNCIDHHHDLPCDPDIGGCNKVNRMQYELRATPYVFTTVLGWQTSRESIGDISATVNAIDVDIDVLTVYQGVLSGLRHRLVSVVCYYGQHYHCFAYNQELARWVMFDDTTVKLIGSWDDVTHACCRGHLQPQVLFYERIAD